MNSEPKGLFHALDRALDRLARWMELRRARPALPRLLRDAAVLLAALILLGGLLDWSPTPRLALRRRHAERSFGPAQILAEFTAPELDVYGEKPHYYLTRYGDCYTLDKVVRSGLIWREERFNILASPKDPLDVPVIVPLDTLDYSSWNYAMKSPFGNRYGSVYGLSPGSRALWLFFCPDPRVTSVQAVELREWMTDTPFYDAEALEVQCVSQEHGVYIAVSQRPLEGVDPYEWERCSLTLRDVRFLDENGEAVYTLDWEHATRQSIDQPAFSRLTPEQEAQLIADAKRR